MNNQSILPVKNAHIIYAHPEPKSFVTAMRDTAIASLESAGWNVHLSDLYAMKFNPVADSTDFIERANPDYLVYSMEQRHAMQTGTLPPDILREVELVKSSDLLVFVFPIYWFSVPAILKGWIDRVFLSGTFYGGKRIYAQGGLNGKKALVIASLGGRAHMFGPGAIHGELSGMMRHFLQGTLGYVGLDVLNPYFAYHVPYINDEARQEVLRDLQEYIARIEQLPCMEMPSLDNFDATFHPLTKE